MTTQKLIMVMGVHRSGTTCLFNSLAQDKTLRAYPEQPSDSIYHEFYLRPERDIRNVLKCDSSPCLLKPVNETKKRSLVDILNEFHDYDLHIVWIYRDPVDAIHSSFKKWHSDWKISKVAADIIMEFSEGWRKRNQFALEVTKKNDHQITIVRFENLISDSSVFQNLNHRLGTKGSSLFKSQSSQSRSDFAPAAINTIEKITQTTLNELDSVINT